MDRVLRVLVVDNSAFARKVIKQMLSRSPFIEVIGAARDGEEALTLVQALHPDVVTIALNMPGLGGLGFIKEQMSRNPIPIVVVSFASETSLLVLDALDSGAIDFVQKPSALATEKVFEMADDLIGKVKAAGNVELPMKYASHKHKHEHEHEHKLEIIVIGISTGGPQALKYLVPRFADDFPLPIAVVLHMPTGYTEPYAKRLNELSALEVREAQECDEVKKGCVLIAPAGRHLTFNRTQSAVVAHLDVRPFDTLHRPSVDVLFRSAAETFGSGVLGVVMTGMGNDGQEGASWIKSKGGLVFAEAEESCVVFGMPRAIIEAGFANQTIPLEEMAEAIVEIANGENPLVDDSAV